MEIKIIDVMTPSQAQAKNNILGSVTLEITADDNTPIVRLTGITVKKSKDGNRFLSMPSFKVGQADKERWLNHYSIFPGKADDSELSQKQRKRMDKLTQDVLRVLDSGGTKQRTETYPKQNNSTASASSSKKTEPWDV
jgi:hypothetical protein